MKTEMSSSSVDWCAVRDALCATASGRPYPPCCSRRSAWRNAHRVTRYARHPPRCLGPVASNPCVAVTASLRASSARAASGARF